MNDRALNSDFSSLLHGNHEYLSMIQSLQVLQHQLIQAKNDINVLKQLKQEAVQDPGSFLNLLRSPLVIIILKLLIFIFYFIEM